jgi:hypothetical protein
LGFSKDEILGQKHSLFKHPNTEKKVYKELWKTILSKKTWHGILTNQTKTFKQVCHYTTIIPILDENNNIYEFVAIKQDLTKFDEMNKSILSQSVKSSVAIKNDDILKLLPFAAVLFDKKSKITHHNKLFDNFVSDLSDTKIYTNLVSNKLSINDLLNFKGIISTKDNDFLENICDMNESATLEASADTINGNIELFLKVKKVDDSLYVACLVYKEDLESCFLVQES